MIDSGGGPPAAAAASAADAAPGGPPASTSCADPQSVAPAAAPSAAQRVESDGVVRDAAEPSGATQLTAQGAPASVAVSAAGRGGPRGGAARSTCVAPLREKEKDGGDGDDAARAVTLRTAASAGAQSGSVCTSHKTRDAFPVEAMSAAQAGESVPLAAVAFAGESTATRPAPAPATAVKAPVVAEPTSTDATSGHVEATASAGAESAVNAP